MSTRSQREKGHAQNTNQVILAGLLKEEANKYCSDCGAKGKAVYESLILRFSLISTAFILFTRFCR
jgi:hypothetical protein